MKIMKKKVLLPILMLTMSITDVNTQTKSPSPKVAFQKETTPQEQEEDGKIEFRMKFVDEGKLVIDSINKYYVIPFTGKSAHQLYMDQLARIASIYLSPDRVTEKVEDKTIVINAAESKLMSYLGVTGRTEIIVKYRIEMQFKDGKIRLNPPSISKVIKNINSAFSSGHSFEDVNINKSLSAIEFNIPGIGKNIEEYFNFLFEKLIYGNGKQDDDW